MLAGCVETCVEMQKSVFKLSDPMLQLSLSQRDRRRRRRKGATSRKRQQTSKSVKTDFDIFGQFLRRANQRSSKKVSKIIFDNFRAAPIFRPFLGASEPFAERNGGGPAQSGKRLSDIFSAWFHQEKIGPKREVFGTDIPQTYGGHSRGCPGPKLRAGPRNLGKTSFLFMVETVVLESGAFVPCRNRWF